MIPTPTQTVSTAPAPTGRRAARIIARTEAHITRLIDSDLPFSLAMECAWWHILEAGRALDRVAAHTDVITRLEPTTGGGQ